MKTTVPQDKYTNIITSLVNSAVMHTEGIASDEVFLAKNKKASSNNVTLFFDADTVTIDVYVNVFFGYSVADVSCALQEKIISDVTENTTLIVKNVNIIVNSVIFN